ncbi:MAG: invasion associated locus B family protein [Pseudomonadota bacterium]
MTRTLARLVLGLGLFAALSGATLPASAQTTAPANDVAMGVPDGLPDQATAQVGNVYLAATFDGWQQRCVKKEDGADPCQLYQLLKDDAGNAVSEISFFTLPEGSQAVMGATVLAPLETLLTANLRIGVDAGTVKIYPFSYCTVNGCVAKVGFTAEDLAAMQAGTEAVMSVVPAASPDKTVVIKIALKGFTAGHQAIVDAAAKVKK